MTKTELPTIQRPIDNTALSVFMKCPREYKLAMIDGWKRPDISQALSFGAFWHRLLETHYKTGGDAEAVLDTFQEYQSEVPDSGDYRTAARAYLEYKRYIKKYPPKKDCKETVGFPDSPMVEISTAIFSDVLGHEYAGKIDRIIMSDGLGYVEDHKTTSRKDKHYFRQYHNSNQMKGYVWMAQQLVPDLKIVGARINLAHILTNKSDFDRYTVTFPQSMIDEWEDNTRRWLKRIKRAIEEDDFPAHFGDNGCKHVYGLCQFFEVCNSGQSIREKFLEQNYEISHWDPLEDH